MPQRPVFALSLAAAGVLTAAVLVVNVGGQFFDSNFQTLSEATSLLAGDHPYRDFFEWGLPAGAYLSAAMQWLVGYRLIGEFVLQSTFITAGTVIAFHLGRRLSGSTGAAFAALAVALPVVSSTPLYHYSKLFVFPAALWCGWWYLDRPTVRRGALLGCVIAVGFLFRHDYVLYIAFLAIACVVLASLPLRDGPAPAVRQIGACALAAAAVVAPWAIYVQMSEGFVAYAQSRTGNFEAVRGLVYGTLLDANPIRDLAPDRPPPTPGTVAFVWNASRADETVQRTLEQRLGLRRLEGRDQQGRLQYEVANIYDTRLVQFDPYINDGAGFDWDRLQAIRWRLPPRDNALAWLMDVMLLIPVLLLIAGGVMLWRTRGAPSPDGTTARRLVAAGAFLIVINSSLFRQPSYIVTVAPLTLALGARFLARGHVLVRSTAVVVLLLTGYGAVVWARDAPMFQPMRLGSSMADSFTQLLASPPVLGQPSLRYLYDCTAPADRLIVTGSTPYALNYYVQRSIAGGHLYWHSAWRSDPAREAQSLALLSRQRVPFAYSSNDPVLDEFKAYPRIREYLATHFTEVEGYNGRLLVNTTLQSVRGFGPSNLPCFH